MPEGPEIKLATDKVHKAVAGKSADRIEFGLPALKRYEKTLTGKRVLSVTARGKAVLCEFDNNLVVYSHNQLYGKWLISKDGSLPDITRQLRFAIFTDTQAALLYSASDISVLHKEEVEPHPYIARLGPDTLNQKVTQAMLVKHFKQKRFAGKRLHTLMLDQGFVAGVGNYLRSEILWLSRLHPDLRLRDLGESQIKLLAANTLKLIRQSYKTKGITNNLELAKNLETQGHTRSKYRHSVFARAGLHCYECHGGIQRLTLGGRRVYICPKCQAAPA